MQRSTLWPIGALLLGGGAAALRIWHRAVGYDDAGLPVPGALPGLVLVVYLFLCAGVFLILAVRRPKSLEDQTSAAPRGQGATVLLGASGVLILAAGTLNLLNFASGWLEVSGGIYASSSGRQEAIRVFLSSCLFPLVLALASVPAAISLLLRARMASGRVLMGEPISEEEIHPLEEEIPVGETDPEEGPTADGAGEEDVVPSSRGGRVRTFAALMPPIFCWLWLVETYRIHTSGPILWNYVLLLFAVLALLISGYFRAGFAFGVGRPRRSVWISLLALFFSAAALPDAGDAAAALTLAALALHALAELTALLAALEDTPMSPELKEEPPHE